MQPTRPHLRPMALPIAFVVGAVLGTVWDQFHVRSSTISYAEPTLAGQPWWVPPQFGIAFVLAVIAFAMLGDPAPRRASRNAAGIEAVWLTAVYATTAFFSRYPLVLAAVLLFLLAARAGDVATTIMASPIPALALLVGGPLYEAVLVNSGQYEYRTQELGPLPIWLPLLWAHSLMFIARLTEALLQQFGIRRPPPEEQQAAEGTDAK